MKFKTTFAGASPWDGLTVSNASKSAKEQSMEPYKKPSSEITKAPKSVPKTIKHVDLIAGLQITADKPKKRQTPPSKYEPLFEKLKPGQSIKCATEQTHTIVNALRGWTRRRNLKWKTAMTLDYGDGFGRVFRVE